mgnify:CR=1 FL=1
MEKLIDMIQTSLMENTYKVNILLPYDRGDILSKIKNNSYVIALAIDGKNLSSEELADTMSKLAVRGNSHITFIIPNTKYQIKVDRGGNVTILENGKRVEDLDLVS